MDFPILSSKLLGFVGVLHRILPTFLVKYFALKSKQMFIAGVKNPFVLNRVSEIGASQR